MDVTKSQAAKPREQNLSAALNLPVQRAQTVDEGTVPNETIKSLKVAQVSEEDVKKAVEQLNVAAKFFDNKFKVEMHEETNRFEIKIIDAETDQVIRSFPPEEILDIVAKFKDMAGVLLTGLFFDKKV